MTNTGRFTQSAYFAHTIALSRVLGPAMACESRARFCALSPAAALRTDASSRALESGAAAWGDISLVSQEMEHDTSRADSKTAAASDVLEVRAAVLVGVRGAPALRALRPGHAADQQAI